MWAERLLCLLALAVVAVTTRELTGSLVLGALFLLPPLTHRLWSGRRERRPFRDAFPCAAFAGGRFGWGGMGDGTPRHQAAASWWLRHDGQMWSWQLQSTDVERDGEPPLLTGVGQLQWALTLGSWWLLRATASRGQGQSAWIWIRRHRLGVQATRLRTRLHWT